MRQLRGVVFPWRSDGACQVRSFNMLCGAMFWLLGKGEAIDESSGGPGLSGDDE